MVREAQLAMLLACAGCQLPSLELEGLSCNDTRPCSEGLFCVDDRCSAQPNLLENPHFEALESDGGLTSWRPRPGTVLMPGVGLGVDGGTCGKVVVNTDPTATMVSEELVVPASTALCAGVWVQGPPTGALPLNVRFEEGVVGGGRNLTPATSVDAGAGWTHVFAGFITKSTTRAVSVRVAVPNGALPPPGTTFLIDEAVVVNASQCPP